MLSLGQISFKKSIFGILIFSILMLICYNYYFFFFKKNELVIDKENKIENTKKLSNESFKIEKINYYEFMKTSNRGTLEFINLLKKEDALKLNIYIEVYLRKDPDNENLEIPFLIKEYEDGNIMGYSKIIKSSDAIINKWILNLPQKDQITILNEKDIWLEIAFSNTHYIVCQRLFNKEKILIKSWNYDYNSDKINKIINFIYDQKEPYYKKQELHFSTEYEIIYRIDFEYNNTSEVIKKIFSPKGEFIMQEFLNSQNKDQ